MGDYRKLLKQLEQKANKTKAEKFKKHNMPRDRSNGLALNRCRRCGKKGKGVIKSYHLNYCHQCFREIASKLGFKKYD